MNHLERLEYALKNRDRLTTLRSLLLVIVLITFITSIMASRYYNAISPLTGVVSICVSLTGFAYCSLIVHRFEKEVDSILLELEVDPRDMEGLNTGEVISSLQVLNLREEVVGKMMRGEDEKGPDWGRSDSELGASVQRRDAISHGTAYDGLEGEITAGEMLKREADERYAEYAQRRWERDEASDLDLVEAGVNRLGDLVTTDFFENNAEEGAFKKAAGLEDKESEDEK